MGNKLKDLDSHQKKILNSFHESSVSKTIYCIPFWWIIHINSVNKIDARRDTESWIHLMNQAFPKTIYCIPPFWWIIPINPVNKIDARRDTQSWIHFMNQAFPKTIYCIPFWWIIHINPVNKIDARRDTHIKWVDFLRSLPNLPTNKKKRELQWSRARSA